MNVQKINLQKRSKCKKKYNIIKIWWWNKVNCYYTLKSQRNNDMHVIIMVMKYNPTNQLIDSCMTIILYATVSDVIHIYEGLIIRSTVVILGKDGTEKNLAAPMEM